MSEQNNNSDKLKSIPCKYITGKVLGKGHFSVVKEVCHIETKQIYACKVISKKLMEKRAEMVRNEIVILQKISSGHENIITLHDYFETTRNVYLCFELCTGGEMLAWVRAKESYYEVDAIKLVRTIFGAVKYLHGAGIVHRDLKPQNILFRRPGNHTQVVLADFGLSQILEGHHIHFLKDICGTPGYMAPEIWDRTGYGKAVDIWALGVITYHLLVGYTPFDRASTKVKMENTLSGGFHFEPSEYWVGISDAAKKFIQECLITDSLARPSADQALELEWLTEGSDSSATRSMERAASPPDLLPSIKTATNAREEWRNVALLRFRSHARLTEPATDVGLGQDIETTSQRFRELVEEAEKENPSKTIILHHLGASTPLDERTKGERAREFLNDNERINAMAKGKST